MTLPRIKGFSLRRPGRPIGSRAVDRNQSDFFPMEKLLAQCGWLNHRAAPRASMSTAGGAAQPLPPATNRGGKVAAQDFEDLKDFCDF